MTQLVQRHRCRPYIPLTAAVLALTVSVAAQTNITPDKNSYTPAQDVQLGQEAAAEAKRQLPMLNDDGVDSFVEEVGETLVGALPPNCGTPSSAIRSMS